MSALSSCSQIRSKSRNFEVKGGRGLFWKAVFVIAVILFPASASAAVTEVTIFRDSARVFEDRKVRLNPQGKDLYSASFSLPPQANPESLSAWLVAGSRLQIRDLRWQPVAPGDAESAQKIRRELLSIREEKNRLRAQLLALEAQLQFWQLQTKAKVKTLNEAQNLTTVLGRQIRKAWEEKFSREQDLERIEGQIRNLEDSLDRIVKGGLPSWELTVLLAGPRSSETTLSFSYKVSGCGWLPRYRLNARPGQGQILFTREAEIRQETGQDWSNVFLTLSSHKPGSSALPPELSSWSIVPRSPSSPPVIKMDGGISPVLFSLGKRDLKTGTKQIIELGEETWPADFTYLARPGADAQVFVQAAINFTAPRALPPEQAIFLYEGAFAGKRNFSLTGDNAMVCFGPDPLVTVMSDRPTSLSCDKDGNAGRKTCQGQWRIEVRNGRIRPVRVRIEEPRPQAVDERIQLSLQPVPPPTEQDASKIVWVVDVPAGGTSNIMTRIRLSAPQDLEVDFGGR
jgi:hypothetical protein